GRTVRAFLGQRMDCAQCHNHPFAEWKQTQFEGLAAQFGKIKLSPVGVEDDQKKNYSVEDQITLLQRDVSASFPFHPEWAADSGTQRQRLAAWVTNEQNHRFDRAIVNRVWGLMFGKPWKTPVDDLPNPLEDENHQPIRDPSDLLDILGNDFRANGCDLKRLIATIAATRVYRLASNHPDLDVSSADKGKVESANESIVEQTWAAFPITRLRPEQIIGSMLQASSVKTIDQNSHWVQRAVRFFSEIDFVREYGDLGDDELGEHVGTIQQALLRLNGEFTRNRSEADPFTAPGRIAGMAQSDEDCVELCFLCCLTRSPTAMEKEHFVKSFASNPDNERSQAVEDLYWTLFNSVEFCWGH
ncbi:MAG: DUF1553 domain-containing protein, partial [Planctomycetes bacterium]|nr:DUF1553 domain-containing protein [Planctomycetota bacterium]